MKKNASILLAAVFVLLLVFTACAGAPAETAPASLPAETETNGEISLGKEVKDLKGHDFLFMVHENSHKHLDTNEVYSDAVTGDKVNDAVFKRNSTIQETYNCTLHEDRATDVNLAVRDALAAGEYTYDFLYTDLQELRILATNRLLVDLPKLENLDLDNPWWDQNLRQGMTVRDHLFFATGDAGTLDDRSCWVTYFNRDLIEKNKLENPYDLVRSGEWTIQKMYELGEAAWQDTDGNGVFSVGEDVAAYIGEAANNGYHVLACGVTLSNIGTGGDISLPATVKDEVLEVWAELKPLLTNPHRDVSDSGFSKGRGVFFACNLGGVLNFGNSGIEFGILPMAKRNAEQKEYLTAFEGPLFCAYAIPVTANPQEAAAAGFTSGTEMCAYFLDVFGYESVSTLTPAFYDQVLKKQMVRDEDSVEMLETALAHKVYDPAIIYNFGGIGRVFYDCGSNGNRNGAVGSEVNYENLVSTYESRLISARKVLQRYLENIEFDESN